MRIVSRVQALQIKRIKGGARAPWSRAGSCSPEMHAHWLGRNVNDAWQDWSKHDESGGQDEEPESEEIEEEPHLQ